jgi:hypothetical protein
MSTLRQHREAMIESCTKAIDVLIEFYERQSGTAANVHDLYEGVKDETGKPLGLEVSKPFSFGAEIMVGVREKLPTHIGCHPTLDLTKDTREQLEWYPPAQVAEGVRYLILGAVTA